MVCALATIIKQLIPSHTNTHCSRPTTRHFTLIWTGVYENKHSKNTLPSWLLPCSFYFPNCRFLTRLCPQTLCIEGKSLTDTLPFSSPTPPKTNIPIHWVYKLQQLVSWRLRSIVDMQIMIYLFHTLDNMDDTRSLHCGKYLWNNSLLIHQQTSAFLDL